MPISGRSRKIVLCFCLLATLAGCFGLKHINFVDRPFVHLCDSEGSANRLLELVTSGNYWLMQPEIERLENTSCPAYHLEDQMVSVLRTTTYTQGRYSELVYFETEFTDIGKRYGWLLQYRASGLYTGAIKEVFDNRTNDGVNEFLSDMFEEMLR